MLELVMALAAEMLVLGRLDRTITAARKRLQASLDSGAAAETFARMVASLGGPKRLLDQPWRHLEQAPVQVPVLPARSGTVRRIDTRAVGMAVVTLGGGRTRPQDPVDHAVGITSLAAPGDTVGPERPIAIVHARNTEQAEHAAAMLRTAYRTSGKDAATNPVVIDRITS